MLLGLRILPLVREQLLAATQLLLWLAFMKIFSALLFLLLRSPAGMAQHTELAALLKQKNVPGMQLVYSKSGVATVYQLGLRKSGIGGAVDAQTVFQAASLGKVVLAYLALRLHDQGRLDLGKPLLNYCPYPRLRQQPNADKITARMVLAHLSGLPNWAQNPLAAGWGTSALKLKYRPDSCWNYSGEGYVWLQKTLEQISGKSLEKLAQEEVFGPLQMANSSFVWQTRFAHNAAFGHDKTGKPTEIRQFAWPNGAFSLLSNAEDYNRFLQAILSGKSLQPATRQLLTSPASDAARCATPPSPTDPFIAWAAGVGLAATSHGPALWHWGDNGDFQGFFMMFPEKQESVVLLTNSANGLQLTDDVLRLLLGTGQYRAMQWLAEER